MNQETYIYIYFAVAVCECFQMYSGEKCQIESAKMKVIKTTIRFTSILAIIIILCFYLLFFVVDLLNFYTKRKKDSLNILKNSKRSVIYRYEYKN